MTKVKTLSLQKIHQLDANLANRLSKNRVSLDEVAISQLGPDAQEFVEELRHSGSVGVFAIGANTQEAFDMLEEFGTFGRPAFFHEEKNAIVDLIDAISRALPFHSKEADTVNLSGAYFLVDNGSVLKITRPGGSLFAMRSVHFSAHSLDEIVADFQKLQNYRFTDDDSWITSCDEIFGEYILQDEEVMRMIS